MICQECQQETATVHITKIINGRKTELHLCHRCAQAHDELDFLLNRSFHCIICSVACSEKVCVVPGKHCAKRRCSALPVH